MANLDKKMIIIVGAAGHQGFEYYNILKDKFNIVALVDNKTLIDKLYPDVDIVKCNTIEELTIDFDVAIVCVPHDAHSKIAVPLLKKGKTVIKEKPFAISLEESELYNENMNLFTIVQRQFNPMFISGKEKIKELGKVYNYNYTYNLPFSEITKGWRSTFDVCRGGVLLDMGYHILDILLSYFGKPLKVESFQSYCYKQMEIQNLEDSISLLMLHENGVQGTVTINRHSTHKKETLKILGENGYLRIEPKRIDMYNREGNLCYTDELNDNINPKSDMFEEYIKNIDNKEYLKEHIKHHKDMVDTISQIYYKARKAIWIQLHLNILIGKVQESLEL